MGDDKQPDNSTSENSADTDDMDSYEAELTEDFIKDSKKSLDSTSGESIDASIDKLESLIAESKIPTERVTNVEFEIPILTDVVDTTEMSHETESTAPTENNVPNKVDDAQIDRLSELVNTVDKKLSKELDSLVVLLKDTIKDSIIDELKEELRKNSESSNTDSKDKPSE